MPVEIIVPGSFFFSPEQQMSSVACEDWRTYTQNPKAVCDFPVNKRMCACVCVYWEDEGLERKSLFSWKEEALVSISIDCFSGKNRFYFKVIKDRITKPYSYFHPVYLDLFHC